jgi:hypothetical protein
MINVSCKAGKRDRTRPKRDPLLQYLYHARHVDQHYAQSQACFHIMVVNVVLPPLASAELCLDLEKGLLVVKAGDKPIQCVLQPPARKFHLLAVTNRSSTFNPPMEHLGVKIDGTDPLLVAEKGLAFYEDFLQQAEAKIFPTIE